MPKSKFKKLFIFFLILFIVFVGVFLVQKQTKERGKDKPSTITKKPFSPPQIIKYYEGILPLEFDIKKDELILPTELPAYFLEQKPFDNELIEEISKNLGLTVDPIITEDAIFGKTYIYSHKEAYLRILPHQRIIDYKTGVPLGGTILQYKNKELLSKEALAKVVFLDLISPPQELTVNKIRLLSIGSMGELSTEGSPNATSINFIKKIDNYPILGTSAETGVLHIILNSKDELYSVYLDDLPEITNFNSYRLKTFDEIRTESPTYSSIQSVNNGLLEPSSLVKGSIEQITITEINIGYLQTTEKDQETLQPVYVLNGNIKFKTGETYPVTLYLPAISRTPYK